MGRSFGKVKNTKRNKDTHNYFFGFTKLKKSSLFPLQDEIENMVRQAEQHAQEDSGMYLIDFLNVLIKTRDIIISNYFFPLCS